MRLPQLVFALASVLAASSACSSTDQADDDGDEGALNDSDVIFSSSDLIEKVVYATSPNELVPKPEADVDRLLTGSVSPPLRTTGPNDALKPLDYLRRASCLGYLGPMGPYGPLGALGPIGGRANNADTFVSGGLPWSDWASFLTDTTGPLSRFGPLGELGPLNPRFWDELPEKLRRRIRSMEVPLGDRDDIERVMTNDFITHLKPGGLFAVLGPFGLTGPMGPLGPLGPAGAHGYRRAEGGDYQPTFNRCHHSPDGRNEPPCRVIEVAGPQGRPQRFGLFERYDEERAKQFGGDSWRTRNDTSFMVVGSLSAPREVDEYRFYAEEGQWVYLGLVPSYARYDFQQAIVPAPGCESILSAARRERFDIPREVKMTDGTRCTQRPYDHRASYDDFDLELAITANGRTKVIKSTSRDFVEWMAVRVPAETSFKANVSLHRAWQAEGGAARDSVPWYRLIVVGSTSGGLGGTTNFKGNHLKGAR